MKGVQFKVDDVLFETWLIDSISGVIQIESFNRQANCCFWLGLTRKSWIEKVLDWCVPKLEVLHLIIITFINLKLACKLDIPFDTANSNWPANKAALIGYCRRPIDSSGKL